MVSSINKTDCHDITEILLKVALNTIKQTNNLNDKTDGIPGTRGTGRIIWQELNQII